RDLACDLTGKVTAHPIGDAIQSLLRHHEEAVLVDVALHADVALACDLDAHRWRTVDASKARCDGSKTSLVPTHRAAPLPRSSSRGPAPPAPLAPNPGPAAGLCAAPGSRLGRAAPRGFSIADRALRGGGLDYGDKVFLPLPADGAASPAASPGARRWLFTS